MSRRIGLSAALQGCLVVGWMAAGASGVAAQTFDIAACGQDRGAGARAMGMAGAFTAIADDATAISWNPAGPVELDRPALSVGLDPWARIEWSQPSLTVGRLERSPSTATAKSRMFSHASMAAPFRLGRLKLVAQAGYRRALDFGFDRTWDYEYKEVDPIASATSTYSYASSEKGGLDVLSAGVGLRLAPAISVGVAMERWTGKATTQWRDRDSSADGTITNDSTVEQSYTGFGARVGLRIAPHPKVALAATARLPFQMNYDLTTSTRNAREILETQIDVSREGRIDWPASFGVGLAYRPVKRLQVAVDATWAQWSKGVFANHYTYSAVTTYLGQTRPAERYSTSADSRLLWPTLLNAADAKASQAGTMQTRLGLEYSVRLGPSLSLPLRAGSWIDQQLERDADGKSPRALGFAVGIGLATPHATLDAAWTSDSSRSAVAGATDRLKRTGQRVFLSVSLRP